MIFRRNPWYASIILVPLFVICGIITWFAILNLYREFSSNKPNLSLVFLCLLGIYGVFILITLIVSYFKKTPTIKLNKSSIVFGNGDEIPFSSITNITYTGNKSMSFLLTGEGMEMEFIDKTQKVVLDELYTDLWKLKLSLYQLFTLKKEPQESLIKSVSLEEYQHGSKVIFKGFVLFSFMGFLSYFFSFLFFIIAISELGRSGSGVGLIAIYGIFLFVILSYGLHYFVITENVLIIKNHNFFWKNEVYRLSDIKEISFEQRGKSPNFIRIINNDFRMKVYRADTLGKKQWKNLKEYLEAKDVKVNDYLNSFW